MAQTLAQIREALDQRGLRPNKKLGQNFLIDGNLVRKLVDASGARAGDVVLEVGPGTGTLTETLLDHGCEVIACELDRSLADMLRDRFSDNERFTLIEGDCLASKRAVATEIIDAVGGRPFRLVANLPYGAATPLMLALLVDHPNCASMWVTIQLEVADRLLARPGTKQYGTVGVVAQALCEVEKVADLPPECFWPRPDVKSAMVGLTRLAEPLTDDPARLASCCQKLFTQRRKQLGSVLGRATPLPQGIDPGARAEQLDPAQLVALCAGAPIG